MTNGNAEIKKYPTSRIQQQFWMINQIYPESSAYNIPSVFEIKGNLNIEALEKSINCIVERHSIFRTKFVLEGAEPLQYVFGKKEVKINVEEITEKDGCDLFDEVDELISEEIVKPFDLANDQVIRVRLFCLPNDEYWLSIVIHHIAIDLESKNIFAQELSTFYNNILKNNENSKLNNVESQYYDYAIWQKEWTSGEDYQKKINFWKNQLENKKHFLNLPLDEKRLAVQAIYSDEQIIEISQDLSEKIKEFSKLENISLFVLMLSAYYCLLFKYSRQENIIVGVPFANRKLEKHKNTVGCFVNILPIVVDINKKISYEEVIKAVRKEMLLAHRNQEVPIEDIIKDVKPIRDSAYNALFQVGFTFEPTMNLKLDGLEVEPVVYHNQGLQLDMFVNFWQLDKNILGRFEYNPEIFNEETIEKYINDYISILKSIINNKASNIF